MKVIKIGNQRIRMCHFPLLSWDSMDTTWMLHGHTHSHLDEANIKSGLLRCDVGVDAHNFAPVCFDQLGRYFLR